MLTLIHSDHVMSKLSKDTLLDNPVVLFMKSIFNPIAEFKVEFKLVLRKNVMVINSLEQVSSYGTLRCIRLAMLKLLIHCH